MIGALFYLRLHSFRNRVRSRLRRLKEPKYLIGGIVGLLYFYGMFFRNVLAGRTPTRGGAADAGPMLLETRDLVELVGAWVLLVIMALVWIVPSRRGALEFSEAEIQFLFPAPVTRRGLLHYKLLSWQIGILFTSLVVSFFSGRLFRAQGVIMAVVGWWTTLLLIQFHALAASFARERWLSGGANRRVRQWLLWGAIGVVALLAAWWMRRSFLLMPLPEAWSLGWFRGWVGTISESPLLGWVLWPLRQVVRLTVAREPREFLLALLPAWLLVLAHYFWVLRANVAFEEAAVEQARMTAERVSAAGRRAGGIRPMRARGRRVAPFRLGPEGPLWVALGWKNLIAAGTIFRARTLVRFLIPLALCLIPLTALSILGATTASAALPGAVVGTVATGLLWMSVIIGPGAVRYDLRLDMAGAGDQLKAMPLTGREVILGELFAPWCLLSVVQAVLALVGMVFLPGTIFGGITLDAGRRLAVLVAALLIPPALSLIGLCLQNLAVLWFPAWVLVSPGQARGGFEVMGQQIIVMAGQIFAFMIAVIPAGLLAGGAFALFMWLTGPWFAVVPAAVVATVTLLAEAAALILYLGWLWERTDLSCEQIP